MLFLMPRAFEKPTAKDFGVVVNDVNREKGHVVIQYGEKKYKWFLRETGPLLINGRSDELSPAVERAMKEQVLAILGPALRERAD